MSEPKKIAVLISGRGSNMLSILDACLSGDIKGNVELVLSNKKNAAGLEKATKLGCETLVISHKAFPDREAFDRAVVNELQARSIDLICLAGFMRLLSPVFVRAFRNRILNIHPSLLPSFPGLDAQWQAAEHGVKISGVTVHFVDEELDHGPIIMQRALAVQDSDSGEELAERILKIEHWIYPQAVRLFCDDRIKVVGGRVYIN